MALNESAINGRDLLREWSMAHDELTFYGVPIGNEDTGALWSLPSRVEWLGKQRAEARALAEALRRILNTFDRANQDPQDTSPLPEASAR